MLRDLGLPDCVVVIEESVHAWATARGLKVKSPFLPAMAVTVNGVPTSVFRNRLTRDMQTRVKNRMEFSGFEVAQLLRSSAFLEHLVLHEAAHHVLPHASEEDCDQWAFEHLAGRREREDSPAVQSGEAG